MRHIYLTAIIAALLIGCAGLRTQVSTPNEQYPWVIRTDFSDNIEWNAVCQLIAAPQIDMGQKFYAYVQFVSERQYSGMEYTDLVRSLPSNYPGFVCFIVDKITFTHDDRPILVVYFAPNSLEIEDYKRTPNQTPDTDIKTFRAIPSTIQSIENNLSIANMDFDDFSDSVDDDGVFRGFP